MVDVKLVSAEEEVVDSESLWARCVRCAWGAGSVNFAISVNLTPREESHDFRLELFFFIDNQPERSGVVSVTSISSDLGINGAAVALPIWMVGLTSVAISLILNSLIRDTLSGSPDQDVSGS